MGEYLADRTLPGRPASLGGASVQDDRLVTSVRGPGPELDRYHDVRSVLLDTCQFGRRHAKKATECNLLSGNKL